VTTSLSGLGGIGAPNTVGNETPDWEFPYGKDRVSQEVQKYFFRADAGPTGMNAAEKPSAAAVEEFRRLVNTGIIRPKNEAAKNITRAQGGLRAGDETLLGPIINGMPEGLTPEYWSVVIQKAQQAANEQIAIMNATGYFEGKTTLDRERIEAEIKDNIANTEIRRRLADETIRKNDMDEAFRRDESAQQMRQNIIAQFGYDPGPMGAAGVAAGNQQAMIAGADGVPPIPGSQQFQQLQQERMQAQSTGQAAPSDAPGTAGAAGEAGPNQAKAQAAAALKANPQYQQLEQQINDPNTPPEQRQALVAQAEAMQQQAEQSAAAAPAAAPGGATGVAGQYGTVGAGGTRPNMTTSVGQDIGWQYVDGQGWQQTIGGRTADLAQQNQAWQQQADVAKAASNPRDYIYAQMLGNARGGLAGQPPTNQMTQVTQSPYSWGGNQMPGTQMPGMPGAPGAPGMPGMPATRPAPAMPMPDGMAGADGRMMADVRMGMPDGMAQPEPWQNPQALMGGLPQGQTVAWDQMQRMGPENLQGQIDQYKAAQLGRFQAPGSAGMGMWGMRQQPMAQPLQAGQPGQMGMPGQMPGQMPGMRMGQQPGGPANIAVGAFSNALNQNRLVPKTGGMGTQGSMQTMGQIGQTNPQKWRAQDFMRGNASEKQQALGTASAAGFSDDDTMSMLGKSLPTFKAPGAGAMT
jgi:hypothetical protein